jgi:hypothetical protein
MCSNCFPLVTLILQFESPLFCHFRSLFSTRSAACIAMPFPCGFCPTRLGRACGFFPCQQTESGNGSGRVAIALVNQRVHQTKTIDLDRLAPASKLHCQVCSFSWYEWGARLSLCRSRANITSSTPKVFCRLDCSPGRTTRHIIRISIIALLSKSHLPLCQAPQPHQSRSPSQYLDQKAAVLYPQHAQ